MSVLSYIEQAERWFGDTTSESSAQVMATLAIAEQLKRIADALENLSGAYTTANFGAMPASEDDSMSEFQAEKKQAQEWAAGLRRGMGLE